MRHSLDRLQNVARRYDTRLDNAIKPATFGFGHHGFDNSLALQVMFDRRAWLARLAHFQKRRSRTKSVAYPNITFQQSGR